MLLTLAVCQYPVTYHHSLPDWVSHTGQWVQQAAQAGSQMLLFPEYGSMELVSLLPRQQQADLRTQVEGMSRLRDAFCSVFSDLAHRYGVVIAAPSFPVMTAQGVVNRCFVFGPQGRSGYQDKLLMTRFEREDWHVQPGQRRLCVFEADWGKFGVQICYDIEFPAGAAALCAAGAQVVLAPSCTETVRGSARVHTGARARALEQQCYTAVSPLIGNAPWSAAVDVNYGYAALYSTPDRGLPETGIVARQAPQQPGWLVHTLDLALLEVVRQDGQTLNFQDQQALVQGWAGTPAEVVRQRI